MVSFRAIFLYLLIMVERVFIIYLRGNLCMLLKHEMNFLEMRAISIYHLFELCIYLSAWAGGKFCLRKWKIVGLVQMFVLLIGLSLLFYGKGFLHKDDIFPHRALFTSAFCFVGISHGLHLAFTLRAMDTDIIRSSSYLNVFFYLFLVTDAAGYIGLTYVNDYMMPIWLGLVILLIQFFILLFFLTDKTEFQTYDDPFVEWKVYIDAYFQRLVIYANENIETRKTFKETRKERKMRMIKELLQKRRKLIADKQGPKVHYLDIAIPKYGQEFINDVKLKWRMRALFAFLPLVWVGIELQYSYWMLSVYRMKRESFLKPPQLILGVNHILNFIFFPVFFLFVNSILKFARFHTGMHRMVIGGLFVVTAVFMGLNIINQQEIKGQKANEPYFNQVKQVVINGIRCNMSFNEKIHVESQQSFGMKTGKPVYAVYAKHKNESKRRLNRNRRQVKPVLNFDEYYESYDLDAFVFEWNWSTFFDMVIYYIDPTARGQMLTVFPYDCKDRAPFDFPLDVKDADKKKGLAEYDIIFISPPDLSKPKILRVGHQREDESRPGLRFLFGNETEVKKFNIYQGNTLLYSFPGLEDLTTDFYWLPEDENAKISFVVDGATLSMGKFVFRKGGLYNVVFKCKKEKPISLLTVYYAEPPFSIHFLRALPQFILMAIGELMFGLMGLQFFIDETPDKLKYHTMLDWYWALAMANVIILFVIHSGFWITYFYQVYWLCIIVLFGYFFFFYFTFRFPFIHLRPGEKPQFIERPVEEMPTEQEIMQELPTVEVTVAADPNVEAPVPPEVEPEALPLDVLTPAATD